MNNRLKLLLIASVMQVTATIAQAETVTVNPLLQVRNTTGAYTTPISGDLNLNIQGGIRPWTHMDPNTVRYYFDPVNFEAVGGNYSGRIIGRVLSSRGETSCYGGEFRDIRSVYGISVTFADNGGPLLVCTIRVDQY